MTDRPPISPECPQLREDAAGTAPQRPGSDTQGEPNKRRPVPPHLLVTVAIIQAGNGIKCPLCGLRITHEHKRILEHLTPVAFGGGNTVDNLRFVHAACAAKKTNGNAATCANGDLHKIAKAKRLDRAREAHRAVLAGERQREPGKIKSRGFPKVHRPMRRPT